MDTIIGIDIGGTKTAVCLWSVEGDFYQNPVLVDKTVIDTRSYSTPVDLITTIIDTSKRRMRENGINDSHLISIGISCGGPLDRSKGLVLSPPNLPGWRDVPIVQILNKAFGVCVAIENDANACALAEWKFGAGRGLENLVFLTFGTGLGAGLILNGALYRGTSEMAGEIGHVRIEDSGPVGYGKKGSAEGFCSGAGIAQMAQARAVEELNDGGHLLFCSSVEQISDITAKDVAIAAYSGDVVAREIFAKSGQYLGKTLAILIDLLNPQRIVIGSIFSRARSLLWPQAEEALQVEGLQHAIEVCQVVPAELGEQIGDYAALAVAIDASYSTASVEV